MTSSYKTISFVLLALAAATVHAGQTVFTSGRAIAFKGSAGQSVTFPDICKTPAPPASPVPIPYPNMVWTKKSEYGAGSKKTKDGGTVSISYKTMKTRTGALPVYEITARTKSGSVLTFDKPTIIEMADGSYCAVCAEKGRISRVMLLKRARPIRAGDIPQRIKPAHQLR